MRNTKIFLVSVLLLTAVFTEAKENCLCEKAYEIHEQHALFFNNGNLDSAVWSAVRLKNEKSVICDIFYHNWLSQIRIAQNKFSEARVHLNEEYRLLKKLDCPGRLSRHFTNFASYFQYSGDLDSAVYYSLNALEMAEKANDIDEQIRVCSNLAAFFNQLNRLDKELVYERQAVLLSRKSKNTNALAMTLPRLVSVLLNYAVEEKGSTAYLDTAYTLAKESMSLSAVSENPFYLLESYHNFSRYYDKKMDYDNVLRYADSMLLTAPSGTAVFYRYISLAYLQKSYAYEHKLQYVMARSMADSALRYANLFNIQISPEPLKLIYRNSKVLGDGKRALWAFERLSFVKDSLFTLEKDAVISELEKKYNQAKNEKKIRELAQQKRIYTLVILAALLALLLIFFYTRQQSLKNKQTILETEQRLNRARMNPHFFFNALTTLQSFALKENDGKSIASSLSKFSHIMRETLESTYKDYVTVDHEFEFLNEYLELQTIRFPEKFSYSVTADENLETDECLIPSMIVQPFAENSIEHGFSDIDYRGMIEIHFSSNHDSLIIQISDNGKGLPTVVKENTEHISRASQIVKDRIYLLNIKLKTKASFSIANDTNGNGVKVQIQLPLLYKNPNHA